MKRTTLITLAAACAVIAPASAAVTLYAEYHLGEAGSLAATTLSPQDSSGNGRHFASNISGATAATGNVNFHPNAVGSTAYLDTSDIPTQANEGWYASNLYTSLPTDNFAFGVFASADSLSGTNGDVFILGGSNGSFKLSLEGTGWRASAHGISYIGSTGTFAFDQWVHLALIRSGGVTTFYIDGVAQGAGYAGAPVHDTPHLSVNPGGTTYFDGRIDEARVVTFDAGESPTNVINALQGVPEPSTALLGALGALALLRRRR